MNCSKHQSPIIFICSHDDCYNIYCKACMKDHTSKFQHKNTVIINAKSKEVFQSWNTYILPKINEIIAYVVHKGTYEILSTSPGQQKIIMCNQQVAQALVQVLQEQANIIENNIQLLKAYKKNFNYDRPFAQSMARIFTKTANELGNIIAKKIQKKLLQNYPQNQQYKKLKLHLKNKVIDSMHIFKEKIIADFQASILNKHLVDRLLPEQSHILKLCKSQLAFPVLKNFQKNHPQQSNNLCSLASMAKIVKEQIILSPDSYSKTPKAPQSKSMFVAQPNQMKKSFDDGQKSTASRKINCKYITQQHLKHLSMDNLFQDSYDKQSLQEKEIKRLRIEINGLRHENQEKDKQIEQMKKTFELAKAQFERLEELFSLSKLNGQKFESLYKLLSLHSTLQNKTGPLDTHIKEKVWKLKSQLIEEKQKQENPIEKINFNSITKFVNKKYIDNLRRTPNQTMDLEPQRCSLTERQNKKLKAEVYVLKTQIHSREKQLKKQIEKNNELTKIINKLEEEDDKLGQKIQDLGNKTSETIKKKTLTVKNFCELQRDHLESEVKIDELKSRLKQRQMKIKHFQKEVSQLNENLNIKKQLISNIENTILKYGPKKIKTQKVDSNTLLCQQLETILKRNKSRNALQQYDEVPSINIIKSR